MINFHTISSKRVTSENNYIPGLTRLRQRADRRRTEGEINHNDKPIRCTSCTWKGIEADLNNNLCPDCQSLVRPRYFGTIQDSLRALRAIGQEMSAPVGIEKDLHLY